MKGIIRILLCLLPCGATATAGETMSNDAEMKTAGVVGATVNDAETVSMEAPEGAGATDSLRIRSQRPMRNWSLGGRGLRLGLFGLTDTVRGVQANLLTGYAHDVKGLQLDGMLSTAMAVAGVQMSGISAVAYRVSGVQLSAVNNSALSPLSGAQIAGISNVAMGVRRGVQLSGANLSSSEMRGAQVGFYNYSDTLNGVQVGVFNAAQRHPKGWQIGIFNFSRDTLRHSVGLVNVNSSTKLDFMGLVGTSSVFNTAVRFRNGNAFRMVGFGTHYMGLNHHFSGAVYYRAGRYFYDRGRWALSGDVGYSHVETFETGNSTAARRLYSLQAHLNADFRLSERWGLFGSWGYGETRHYRHNRHYRQEWIGQLGVTYRYNRDGLGDRRPLLTIDSDTAAVYNDFTRRRKSWLAAAEVAGINVFVHCFDRFVTKERFAMTTLRSVRSNFKTGFVWDNDFFSTNLIAHPYHGNLYFNAARSLGHSFWQSVPFAFGGSLMWELVGEKDPPAINDLFATTFGGVCIGEITYRLSDCLIDNRRRGMSRFLREALVTIISPMKGFNRIVSGKAWSTSPTDEPPLRPTRLNIDIAAESRYLADNGDLFKGEFQPAVTFRLEYGDILDDRNNKPYDYFAMEATFGFTGNQPLVNNVHLLGRLWSATVVETKRLDSELGFYQHFNYYNSNPVKDGSELTPYKISEAAAVGPGFVFRYHGISSLRSFEQRAFVSAIFLGGTKSDYYNVLDRDYNMGSGYSIKAQTRIDFRAPLQLVMGVEHYRLFTWKGYEGKDLENTDPFYLNAQGDKGSAALTVLKSQFGFRLTERLDLRVCTYHFFRHTHYSYHSDVRSNTFEARVGLAYEL